MYAALDNQEDVIPIRDGCVRVYTVQVQEVINEVRERGCYAPNFQTIKSHSHYWKRQSKNYTWLFEKIREKFNVTNQGLVWFHACEKTSSFWKETSSKNEVQIVCDIPKNKAIRLHAERWHNTLYAANIKQRAWSLVRNEPNSLEVTEYVALELRKEWIVAIQ